MFKSLWNWLTVLVTLKPQTYNQYMNAWLDKEEGL